jgi:hypothetical protein
MFDGSKLTKSKDVIKLEKVQCRATKMIPTLRSKSYEDRLLAQNLFSLEQRRSRGDMIEIGKILNGRENIDMNELFTLDESSITRTNGLELVTRRFATEVAWNSFGYRVLSAWNAIPHNVVNCQILDAFKLNLDKHCRRMASSQAATYTTN